MQMGNMGGMAVCLELALEESYLDVDHVPVLMLLDRRPDVFLARRSGAEGWLVKPLDPLRLRRATAALLDGGTYADDVVPARSRCWSAARPHSRRRTASPEPDRRRAACPDGVRTSLHQAAPAATGGSAAGAAARRAGRAAGEPARPASRSG